MYESNKNKCTLCDIYVFRLQKILWKKPEETIFSKLTYLSKLTNFPKSVYFENFKNLKNCMNVENLIHFFNLNIFLKFAFENFDDHENYINLGKILN